MAVDLRGLPRIVSIPRLTRRSRLIGMGSVFGKTLRDARVPLLLTAALLGTMTLAGGVTMSTTYGTAAARVELAAMSGNMPPMMRGLYGNPVNVDTLGGFVSWHYGPYFALLAWLGHEFPIPPWILLVVVVVIALVFVFERWRKRAKQA